MTDIPTHLGPHHLAIKTADVEMLARFYRDVLGLAEIKRWPDDTGQWRTIWLKCDHTLVMIEKSETPGMPTTRAFEDDPPGFHLVAFAIPLESRDDWHHHLTSHGVSILKETIYSTYFQDPEGNRLALSHYPDVEV